MLNISPTRMGGKLDGRYGLEGALFGNMVAMLSVAEFLSLTTCVDSIKNLIRPFDHAPAHGPSSDL